MKMLSLFMVLLSVLFIASNPAQAEVIGSLGTALNFEHTSDGRDYETRQPLSLRGGYRSLVGDFYLEYSTFQASQGTSYVQVSRDHHEWVAWYRYVIQTGYRFMPYMAFGGGFQYDVVTTNLASETATDTGQWNPLIAGAFGMRVSIWKRLELQLEGKAAGSTNYSPSPLLSLGGYLGWAF